MPTARFHSTCSHVSIARELDSSPSERTTATDPRIVTVTFSQVVKAADFVKGVEIRVNGATVRVLSAVRLETGDKIRYRMGTSAKRDDIVTWAYDAAQGSFQNLNGDNLLSVAAKTVISSR